MAPSPPAPDGDPDRLVHLLSTSPAVTYAARADGSFRTTFISANVSRITGWSPTDFLGPGFWIGHVHPDDAARVRAAFTPSPHRTAWVGEYRFRFADGSWHWIRDESRLLCDQSGRPLEIVGAWSDVSATRRDEEALHRQRDFAHDLIDSLPGLFCLLDEDGRFRLWNRNLEAVTGYGPDEIAGMGVFDLFAEDDHEALAARIAEVLDDRAATEEAAIVAKSGQRIPFLLSAHRLLTPDGTRLVCTGVDVSTRRRADVQLAHASRLALLGEMTASLTHEINQPLNIISLSAQSAALGLLQGTDSTKDTARRLNVILSQIDRINTIVRHMAMLSRRDLGRKLPFGFAEVMANAVELMRPQLAAEGIVLDHRPAPAGHTVTGHPVRLEQVIINLLANAGHAVGQRCTHLPPELQDGRVTLRFEESADDESVRIVVADNGTGIAADALPRLFEPFFTTKPPGKGTGLGLSVSRTIVEEMGGTLTARNTGRGAEFAIRLPLDPGQRGSRGGAQPETAAEVRLAVLVVDDEEDGRTTTAECLARLGCSVTAVGGGDEALAACAARVFDLVLADVRIPGTEGTALLRRLRHTHPDLPLAVMTAHLHGTTPDAALGDGLLMVLRKPLSLEALGSLIERMRR